MKLENDVLAIDLVIKDGDPASQECAELVLKTFFELTSVCLRLPHPVKISAVTAVAQNIKNFCRDILHELMRQQLDGAPISEHRN